ncbi:MAG TPA: cytochrome c oxidase subunit II [Sporichthya sp.]|nr:cytochrome c oxidase subunit II [Sporichthya sp.]
MLALVLVTCTGCDTADLPRLAFPTPATEESPRILLMWQGSWLAALLTGAVVWSLILWACMFHRKKHADDIPIQTRYNLPIEALYTILPFVMVVVLFYFTERDESILLDQDRQEAHTVNVVGRQWSWSFNYVDDNAYETGTPGKQPELWLPVNKVIRFELTSADVIHSWWVPNFLFKLDVMPGRTNSFELTPNKLGTFQGKCAELCGRDHSRMFFTVRVVSEAEYTAHIAELKKNGQEGQLPRGVLNTEEARERAYNLEESYNSEHAGMEGMDHGSPPAAGEQATAPPVERNSEPASDGAPSTAPNSQSSAKPGTKPSNQPSTEGAPATSKPGGTS